MAPDNHQRWLHEERVKLLKSMDLFAHVETFLNAGLLALLLWKVTSTPMLLAWLIGLLAATGLRFALMRGDSSHWDARFIAGAALSGMAWGSAGILLFPLDSVVRQVFLGLIIGGLTAKAIPVFSPILAAYAAFILPALSPLTVRFLTLGDELHLVMGAMGVVYILGMLMTAGRAHQMFMGSLTLRLEKNALVENLTSEIAERKRAETALQHAHDDLDLRVKERTAELLHANRVLSTEIAERKHAEEKIRQQAALLDVAQDAILVVDLEGRILFWNQGAARLYGWTSDETVGKKTETILSRRAPQWEEAKTILMERGQWRGEMHHVAQSGKEIIVESHWTLVRDRTGTPASILTVNSDITEKKLLEKKFLQAQRLDSLGTLACSIAHDINNVLTPILMASQLLKMKPIDDESRQWLNGIEDSVRRGAHMVRQVLFFARGVDTERVPLMVKYLIAELESILKETFPRSITIQTALSPDLWVIVGDFTQIYQALLNLCVNARDAMPNGGRIRLEAHNIVIDEEAARRNRDANAGAYVALSVVDTGTGIPAHVIDKVFDPFFTTKEVSQGTGLGLSTVLGIVKSHGGFVTAASTEGVGTRITAYLPAEQAVLAQDATERAPEPPAGQGELILVVDDEAGVLEVTRATLETHGYQVLTATDGTQAIDLYARHQGDISVVITDMMMPGMDGEAMSRILRRMDPAVKVIAMSGLLEQRPGLGLGPIPFLPKPYTTDGLLGLLQKILKDGSPNSQR